MADGETARLRIIDARIVRPQVDEAESSAAIRIAASRRVQQPVPLIVPGIRPHRRSQTAGTSVGSVQVKPEAASRSIGMLRTAMGAITSWLDHGWWVGSRRI
jgi:hypothetical protein